MNGEQSRIVQEINEQTTFIPPELQTKKEIVKLFLHFNSLESY